MSAKAQRVAAVRAAVERACHQTWPSQVDYLEVGDTLAMCSVKASEPAGVRVGLVLSLTGFDDARDYHETDLDFPDDADPKDVARAVLRWLHDQIEPHQRLVKVVAVEGA